MEKYYGVNDHIGGPSPRVKSLHVKSPSVGRISPHIKSLGIKSLCVKSFWVNA